VLLEEHKTTSVEIVRAYLGQISKHNKSGAHLNCVNSVVPERIILDTASELDRERADGRFRGPYHGISFLVKVRCGFCQSSFQQRGHQNDRT
jgi:amidase